MKKSLIVGLSVWMLCVSLAFAVNDNSLYQAEISVHSQSVEERNAALLPAFQQVLVKVAGDSNVLNNPNLKTVKDLNSLVQAYNYLPTEDPAQSGYILKIQFYQEQISKLLRQASATSWGSERPLLLVWAEWTQLDQPAEIIDSESSSVFHTGLSKAAEKKGIPLLFPLMDLTDLNLVSVNDITTEAMPALENATKHYKSDGMLIVHGLQSTAGYTIKAKLLLGKKQLDWQVEAATLDSALKNLMTQISDSLSKKYSTIASQHVQSNITIKVVGITQREDFEQLKAYLKQLSLIAEVEPLEISGEEVKLSISLRGNQDALAQLISSETKLVTTAESTDHDLIYKWNP